MSELWITGGTAVTMNTAGDILEDAVIHVKNGLIETIGVGSVPPKGAKVVDAKNCLVTPGFVNMHTHSPMHARSHARPHNPMYPKNR